MSAIRDHVFLNTTPEGVKLSLEIGFQSRVAKRTYAYVMSLLVPEFRFVPL